MSEHQDSPGTPSHLTRYCPTCICTVQPGQVTPNGRLRFLEAPHNAENLHHYPVQYQQVTIFLFLNIGICSPSLRGRILPCKDIGQVHSTLPEANRMPELIHFELFLRCLCKLRPSQPLWRDCLAPPRLFSLLMVILFNRINPETAQLFQLEQAS